MDDPDKRKVTKRPEDLGDAAMNKVEDKEKERSSEKERIRKKEEWLEKKFPPREGNEAKEMLNQRYPTAIRENPKGESKKWKIGDLPKGLGDGVNRWKFPRGWLPPLKWYWEQLELSAQPLAS